MLKYLMAYNNHEYGSKSIYRQHMECLNTSWLTTIMSTAARVNTWNAQILMAYNNHEYGSKSTIVNTWNAQIRHGLQQLCVR